MSTPTEETAPQPPPEEPLTAPPAAEAEQPPQQEEGEAAPQEEAEAAAAEEAPVAEETAPAEPAEEGTSEAVPEATGAEGSAAPTPDAAADAPGEATPDAPPAAETSEQGREATEATTDPSDVEALGQDQAAASQNQHGTPQVPPTPDPDEAAPSAMGTEGEMPDDVAEALLAGVSEEDATLPIRMTVQPDRYYFFSYFPPQAPAILLYNQLARLFALDRSRLHIMWEQGRVLADKDIISDVCAIPTDGTPLMLDVEFDEIPEHLKVLGPGEQALRSVEVNIEFGDDIPEKQFFVTLVKGFERKPFLGGYRNKKTEVRYENATTQCHAIEREVKREYANKASRVTQTQGVTRRTQTARECSTQMPRSDLLVNDTYDRVVVAKPYFSADKLLALQVQKTIQLQAYVRGWRARSIAKKMRQERDEELEVLTMEDKRRRDEHEAKRRAEVDRRTHPRTPQDFTVLYNELEAWRLQETGRIKEAPITDAEKKLAMQELLKKETKLLQTIDKLQIQANRENRVKKVNSVLDKMASAKSWGTKSAVAVETPFTIRARELRDLHNGLQLKGVTIDERLDILLHVKWSVKEFECPLTREIVELVDREADLLNRGRKDSSLTALRQRISNLFLQFVETPEFNPEAMQFQRVPLEYTTRPLVRLDRK